MRRWWGLLAFAAAAVAALPYGSVAADTARGERLSFVVNSRGIVSVAGHGGDARYLVKGLTSGATWSPDGRRFLFLSDLHVPPGERCRTRHGAGCGNAVYVANADGSGQRRLSAPTGNSGSPSWSPDGQSILFLENGKLWTVRPDGRDRKFVPVGRKVVYDPSWAEGGQAILFESIDNEILRFDPRAPRKPARLLLEGANPVVSPDGRFVAYGDDDYSLSVLELVTGKTQQVARDTSGAYVWSPDSQQLAYVRDFAELAVVRRDGTGQRLLTTGSGPNFAVVVSISWGPSSLFYSYAGGGVWAIQPNGSGRHKIAEQGKQLAWHPGA